jgi:hypothetical protein
MGRLAAPSSGTGSFDLFGNAIRSPRLGHLRPAGNFHSSTMLRKTTRSSARRPVGSSWREYSFNVNGQETALGTNMRRSASFGAAAWVIFCGDWPEPLPRHDALTNGCDDQRCCSWRHVRLQVPEAARRVCQSGNIVFPMIGGIADLRGSIPRSARLHSKAYARVGAAVWRVAARLPNSDADNINTATHSLEPDFYVWGIGYSYPFSRRTNMYIGYGERTWDGNVSASTLPANLLGTIGNAFDRKQFALGLRHLF